MLINVLSVFEYKTFFSLRCFLSVFLVIWDVWSLQARLKVLDHWKPLRPPLYYTSIKLTFLFSRLFWHCRCHVSSNVKLFLVILFSNSFLRLLDARVVICHASHPNHKPFRRFWSHFAIPCLAWASLSTTSALRFHGAPNSSISHPRNLPALPLSFVAVAWLLYCPIRRPSTRHIWHRYLSISPSWQFARQIYFSASKNQQRHLMAQQYAAITTSICPRFSFYLHIFYVRNDVKQFSVQMTHLIFFFRPLSVWLVKQNSSFILSPAENLTMHMSLRTTLLSADILTIVQTFSRAYVSRKCILAFVQIVGRQHTTILWEITLSSAPCDLMFSHRDLLPRPERCSARSTATSKTHIRTSYLLLPSTLLIAQASCDDLEDLNVIFVPINQPTLSLSWICYSCLLYLRLDIHFDSSISTPSCLL